MGGEFRICHNELVLCTMNPPIQAATVGSREIWEEKRVALVSAAVNPASQRCEGGLTSLAGRYNSNQLSAAGYASQCRYSHCHLRLKSSNIKTKSAEGSIAIWFLEICLKIFVMYLVFWVLYLVFGMAYNCSGWWIHYLAQWIWH